MAKTKTFADAPSVSTPTQGAQVPVFDSSGSLSRITVEALIAAIRDNIRIGGRNYLLRQIGKSKSANVTDNGDGSITITGNQDTYFSVACATDLTGAVGEEFTVSFDCSGMKDGDRWGMEGKSNLKQFLIDIKNGRNTATFNLKEREVSTANTFSFDDTYRTFPNGMSVTLSNFKLERGNMTTDYTPAPEDLVQQTSTSGGVTEPTPYAYAIRQKGGRHESDQANQRIVEESSGGDSNRDKIHIDYKYARNHGENHRPGCHSRSAVCSQGRHQLIQGNKRRGLQNPLHRGRERHIAGRLKPRLGLYPQLRWRGLLSVGNNHPRESRHALHKQWGNQTMGDALNVTPARRKEVAA